MARRLLHRKSRTRDARQSGFARLNNAGAGAAGGATGEDGEMSGNESQHHLRIGTGPDRGAGGAATRREYRHGRPRHGEFRAHRDAPRRATRRLAEREGARHLIPVRCISSMPRRSSTTSPPRFHDVTLAFATTARERGQMKRVLSPQESMREAVAEFSRRRSASRSCSGASARASTMTRFPCVTRSRPSRSIPPSPRSTSPRRCC